MNPAGAREGGEGKGRIILAAAALLAATLLAYFPVLSFEQVWDDPMLINVTREMVGERGFFSLFISRFGFGRPQVEFTGYYRPLPFASFYLDSLVAPFLPSIYHLHNLLLFAVIVLLLFWFLRFFLPGIWPAAAGALVFALNPLHVGSVAPGMGRTDLWAAAFVLLSALAFLRVRRGTAPRPAVEAGASLLFLFLGCLSKEPAVMLPFVLLAWTAVEEGRRGWRRWWRGIRGWVAGWGAVAGAFLLVRFLVLAGEGVGALAGPGKALALPLSRLSPGEFVLLWLKYFGLLGFPWSARLTYGPALQPPGWESAAGVLLLGAGSIFAFRGREGWRGFLAWLGWITAFLLPAAGPVAHGGDLMRNQYLFLSCAAVSLLFGAVLLRMAGPGRMVRPLLAGVLALGVAGGGFASVRSRLPVWRDDVVLFSALVREAPSTSVIFRHNLGSALAERGRHAEAESAYRDLLVLQPGFPPALDGLGKVLAAGGRAQEALPFLAGAVAARPRDPSYHRHLGEALQKLGRKQEAEDSYRRAAALSPREWKSRLALLLLLEEEGRMEEVREEYRALKDRRPDIAEQVGSYLAGRGILVRGLP